MQRDAMMRDDDKTKGYDFLKPAKLQDRIVELEKSIDRRKRKEAAARQESEERYRSLFRNNHSIMLLVDPETSAIVDANPAACAFYGYSTRDLTRRRITDLNALDERETSQQTQPTASEQGNDAFYRHRLASGDIRDVEVHSGPIKIDGKSFLYSIIYDISERKRAEEALHQSNQTLSNILSASPIAIGLADNRTFDWANEAMLQMFGFEQEHDYKGQSARIIYPSTEEFDRVGHIIYNNLMQGRPAETDATFRRKDGSTFLGHLKISSPDPTHPMKRTIFTISDESSRFQAENERIQKEKLKGVLELAGAICHELNQPMMAISGYTELLLMNTLPENPSYQKMANIINQIDRMSRIMKKLMNITRYETKDYSDETKIIDIDKASV